MKNFYQKLKNWCNGNQGFLTLLALIVAIVSIPFSKIDYGFTNSFFDKLILLLSYKVSIPLYLFLIVVLILLFYFLRLKNRYYSSFFSLKFLKGTWKCEWGNDGGHEILTLNEEGQYFIDSIHYFNLTEFKYNNSSREMTFFKTAVREGDRRKVHNAVKVVNNDLLEGLEQNYKIKYTRIAP
jgi:hypothetical protein